MGKVTNIALVHDFLFAFGGAERVLLALHEMYPEAPIYTTLGEPGLVAKHFPDADIRYSPLQRSWLRHVPPLLIGKYPQAVESFDLSGYDTVISSSGAFSHGAITGPDTVHICYCHSPMRYAWDYHAEYLEEKRVNPLVSALIVRPLLHRLRIWDYVSSKRVDRWVANSAAVQGRIRRYYGQESVIVHPPVDTEFFSPQPDSEPPGKYAVIASRLTANKRIGHAILACGALKMPLHIIGKGDEESRLRELQQQCGGEVVWHGPVDEKTKRDVIRKAACFIFASEDDFGIAPVEALSMGIPVIALGRGGATEYVQSGKNGYLYPESSPESLTAALTDFLEKGVDYSKGAIRDTALPFSRARFEERIASIVHAH